MHFRNFSLAVISSLVASGAWYTYKSTNKQEANATTASNGITVQSHGMSNVFSPTPMLAESGPQEQATSQMRRALLVENDQFYVATLSNDQPLSKPTHESDPRALEMLTPEQATKKLRRNEESYHVTRGKGVVRYDIVQVPSNSPIEDDHAEKIVEVYPQAGGSPGADWMFWGVFDGHA